MKVILIIVTSLDGKLTKWIGNAAQEWSSPEDFAHFQKVRAENNLIVMGSGTFNAVRINEKAGLKPENERLRIILTSNPDKYKKYLVPGKLEFSNETPKILLKRLGKMGYNQLLLVSGGKVATSFFKNQLINEVWVTIEPKIFGIGEQMVQNYQTDINLRLIKTNKLNSQGTLLLKYKIIK